MSFWAVTVTRELVLKEITTSSVDVVQGLFVMVHLRVYVVPAVPLNVDVGLAVFENEPPDPLTMLQAPVPTDGVFAARVAEDT